MNSALPRPSATVKAFQPFDINREILASKLSPSAKVLLLTIADHARHGRSSCFASTATLARESAMSARNVQRLLPILEKTGWIQIERATGSSQSRHTIFLAPREGSGPHVKLHEVGHPGACSRTNPVQEVGHPGPTKDSGKVQGKDSRFAPIPQNYNPPTPIEPDPDPNRTAAMAFQDWRRWAEPLSAAAGATP